MEMRDKMESLSKEKVLQVANLAKIEISDKEIDDYSYGLNQIINEIDRINELDIDNEDILISPTDNVNVYYNDELKSMLPIEEVLKNAPSKVENYIEVVRVIND